MPPLRRLLLLAALTLVGGVSASVAADGGSGSPATGAQPQCTTASLKAADAPIRGPLGALVGAKLVNTVFNFITDTPMGKMLADKDAHGCMANLNGTLVGTTLLDRLKTPTCAPFYNLTDVPFVKYGLDALTANASVAPSFNDLLKYLKAVPNSQVEQFCGLYTSGIVPCLTTELLPALAVLRAKYGGGCCDAWNDKVLTEFGYTISGQLTKMAQLFGDFMCAKQTPGFGATESQRCGYTWLQTLVTKTDTASFAATVLRNLQVPTDQMCLRAEGKPYINTNNNSVASAEPTPSGCVVTLDRMTTWVYGLPSTQRSEAFDVKMLLEDGKALPGSELYPTVKFLLPQLASSEVEIYFNKSLVHLPMQFGGKCAYTRPVLLVEWPNEPQPVSSSTSTNTDRDSADGGGSKSTAATKPRSPSQTPLASSRAFGSSSRHASSVVAAVMTTAVLTLTVAR